jgi:hypothetical protein
MSGVQARIHAAMRKEFRLLSVLVREYAPDQYEYDTDDGATRAKDYDDRIDVVPVSNPNASTMAQRIMQHQAVMQLAATAPEIYERKKLHRRMIEAMGIDDVDEILPLEEDMKPMDPVAENMAILTGEPIKTHVHQDHEAHIRVHMAAMQDPKLMEIIQHSPQAQAISGAAEAHVREHVAFQYRREIEKQLGVPMPEYEKDLPAEVEVELSKLVADAADKLLRKDQAEAKAMKIAQEQQDPVVHIQKMSEETKRLEVQRKGMADKLRAMVSQAQIASKEKIAGVEIGVEMREQIVELALEEARLAHEKEKLRSEEKRAGAELGVEVADDLLDAQIERERMAGQEKMEGARQIGGVINEGIRAQTGITQARINARTQREQTAANMAMKFMDLIRGKKDQAETSDEE